MATATADAPAARGIELQVARVRTPPGATGFIGRCHTCRSDVPYGSGWTLDVHSYYGSVLVCGPDQAHRRVTTLRERP